MKNGRCRMHGGKSTGAPRGNANRLTHGFYSNFVFPHEHELLKQAKEVTIDDDIVLMKVMLHRLVRLSGNSEGDVLMVMRCIEAIRKLMLAKWVMEGGSDLASYRIA